MDNRTVKDIVTLVTGFLGALLLFFGTIGLSFEWFTPESVNAFGIALSALAALVTSIIAIWRNTYVSKKAQRQKEMLIQKDLMERE